MAKKKKGNEPQENLPMEQGRLVDESSTVDRGDTSDNIEDMGDLLSYLSSLSNSGSISPMKSDTDYQLVDRFSDEELVQILKNEGYSSVVITKPGRIKIRVESSSILLINSDDGDLQAVYAVSGVKMTYKGINQWNRGYRFSRAYLDDDKDPILEADLLTNAGLNKRDVAEFFSVFVTSIKGFKMFLMQKSKE
ncbi:YbjN domain-containing protein [Maribrevibacterium harenarium]|uniref:YbjN domain-containing protein n=1 Tax=Maribrevibacterium harenarium TaxID=2589817 RepID=A0A501WJ94_9GAMM|nr:YbjN domain-containing protein [Maribrevibacterium harenarium]TPE45686.1 YbjN domain-containing protein [Maribrevibacterium harenarium]